jgi:predicted GIY-YIG superfamily endonuclease
MNSWDKMLEPHCIYRVFNTAGDLLYIGCSRTPCARLSVHGSSQSWAAEMARIEIVWFENEPEAKRAEAEAVRTESPRHNRLVADPTRIGYKGSRRSKGDGVHCPKCAAAKERLKDAYCRSCMREYQKERRRLLTLC